MLLDEAGHIVWACSYQLWGKPIQEIEHSQIQQNLRYQGQYLDRETGLHYNTFRYYDPDIGRFTQPDPIGLLGGFNLYQYASNGLMWVDPWGLKCGSTRKSYEQAKNKALAWLEKKGFKAEKVNIGKFGSTKGRPVGMMTADGKTGFRVEYDGRNGAHINVFSGKDKGEHFLFNATESTVTKLQNLFNHPSKPRRNL
ncbi:RHS repeat domain-containing protein [Snodgrassella alvi]|uniref:RHS repeat domain-containing protein n=1 Tax=Snodgrassella alvi TaxID=1196083 RepID=UPI003517ED31